MINDDLTRDMSQQAAELDQLRFKVGKLQAVESRAKAAEEELEALRLNGVKLER